jgi:penicillin-insensitive murein endopeptidase
MRPVILLALAVTVGVARPAVAEDGPTAAAVVVPKVQGSLSCGSANRGSLRFGSAVPERGYGFETPKTWVERGYRYGTDELVGLIQRAAARVARDYPGSILGVADLSKETGGAIPHHRSHQAGRDADLLYYAIDEHGAYVPPDNRMPVYRSSGKATYSKAPRWEPRIPVRYFDLARNWAFVKALVTDRRATVTNIFVAWRVRKWLLDYAKEAGEPKELRDQVRAVLVVPRNTKSHNDHMHIRIACSDEDIENGRCRNHLAPARKTGSRKWHSRIRCPPRPRTTN